MQRKPLALPQGGCWYCGEDQTDTFSGEFDTNLHLECLEKHLKEYPDDPEAKIMYRELEHLFLQG